jgi:hypothetical protein
MKPIEGILISFLSGLPTPALQAKAQEMNTSMLGPWCSNNWRNGLCSHISPNPAAGRDCAASIPRACAAGAADCLPLVKACGPLR